MGATCPRVFAVPAAPQAGLNNRVVGFQTLSPAKKKQAVPAPQGTPLENFWRPGMRVCDPYGRACVG